MTVVLEYLKSAKGVKRQAAWPTLIETQNAHPIGGFIIVVQNGGHALLRLNSSPVTVVRQAVRK